MIRTYSYSDGLGINPIVIEAQFETAVLLPEELAIPWQHVQRYFGFTSESGTLMFNTVLNVHNLELDPVYVGDRDMGQDIKDSERNFYRLFPNVEQLSLPIYAAMIKAILQHENGTARLCQIQLQTIAAFLDKRLNLTLREAAATGL
ncbi:hypothetical protein PWT90_04636 [Aphanocladium album]|nr:hypothetical protein PWT90_04636 [Aphanocladium album]